MTLSTIIEPEIKNDAFYHAIISVIKRFDISTVLEIGASSGEGSTEAFIKSILASKKHVSLFSIEVSRERWTLLSSRYQYPWFFPYNVSSVPVSHFLTPKEVSEFYHQFPTALNHYPLETVLSWLEQDRDYILNHGVIQDGIQKIKAEASIDQFDCVLIDGSAFTGEAELKAVYGAKVLILDDINDIKNFTNLQKLSQDSQYKLVQKNMSLRNGFAIFIRQDIENTLSFFTKFRHWIHL